MVFPVPSNLYPLNLNMNKPQESLNLKKIFNPRIVYKDNSLDFPKWLLDIEKG